MYFLRHNFIADMPGPQFLFLFVMAIILAHIACWKWRQLADPTDGKAPPPVPPSPDPFGIAYLRGGANEATRLAAFSLIHRGILHVTEEVKAKSFKVSTPQPPMLQRTLGAIVGPMYPAEEAIYQATRVPLLASSIFGGTGVSGKIDRQFQEVQAFLENEELLTTPQLRQAITICNWWAAGCLLLLGSYKLVDAIIEGRHNIGFLMLLMAAVPLSFIPARAPRLTAKGRAYLKQLQTAFHNLHLAPIPTKSTSTINADATVDTMPLVMLSAAIFGMGALQSAAFADYSRMFPKAPAAHSAGCGGGSGCGTSSCGTSSCGGGGCGGSGCGGGCGGG